MGEPTHTMSIMRHAVTRNLSRSVGSRLIARAPVCARTSLPASMRVSGFATASSDSHDDFKSQSKVEVPSDIMKRIQQDIDADDIVVYMKGIPEAPRCGFSNAVVQVLGKEGVEFAAYNVLEDEEL